MILWADSFDHYGLVETNLTDGPWAEVFAGTLDTTHARTGTTSFRFSGSFVNQLRRVLPGPRTVAGCGMAWYFESLPASNGNFRLVSFNDSNNKPQVALILQSTGALAVYRGSGISANAVLLGTSTTLMTTNSFNHVEIKVEFSAVAGTIEVRLNGVTIINLAGINTINSVAPALNEDSASQLQFGPNATATGTFANLDDVIAWDDQGTYNTDFIGDKKVFTDFPDADTADVDWIPSSGVSRYAMIDEPIPDGDTTYDEAANAGDKMGVTFPDVNAATIQIAAVILLHKSRKTDAGTCKIQVSAQSGGSDVAGDERPMTTVYTVYGDVFEEDPDTSAPWTVGGANAMSMLVERTA